MADRPKRYHNAASCKTCQRQRAAFHRPPLLELTTAYTLEPPAFTALRMSMPDWRQMHLLRATGEAALKEHEDLWTLPFVKILTRLTALLEDEALRVR
jgi:hypothetical protein